LKSQNAGFIPKKIADGRGRKTPDVGEFLGRIVFFFGETARYRARSRGLFDRTGG
jgi:hypothetical protein